MAENVHIEGLSELLNNLRILPEIVEKECVRTSMVPGVQLIRNEAQRIVIKRTGLTSRAVHIAFSEKESVLHNTVYHVFVSRQVKAVYPKGKHGRTDRYAGKLIDPFWWHIIEMGSVKMGAKPFMRPAFDSTKRPATEIIVTNLKTKIEAAASALRK